MSIVMKIISSVSIDGATAGVVLLNIRYGGHVCKMYRSKLDKDEMELG